jgi:hypothetical protein
MILSCSLTVLPFVGFMLTGEFISLDEPTKVSEVAAIAVFRADGTRIYRI